MSDDPKKRKKFNFQIRFLVNQISLTVLLSQWNSIAGDPGIIDLKDLPEFRRPREKSLSTKLPSYNSITDTFKAATSAESSSPQSLHTIKLTHEDVVTGTNPVYGTQHQLSNGGIIFAISPQQGQQGSTSQPLMSAGELKARESI